MNPIHPTINHSRRRFLKQSAAGAGLLILPSGIVSGKISPNGKLNLALIGTGGRGTAHFGSAAGENVVALCDIDQNYVAAAATKFPGAKHYADWRKCLEHKALDAIICSTTDHTHAHIANWAMKRGIHVYCEKPIANSVGEARTLRKTYLDGGRKIATQVGTQLHGNGNYQRVKDLIRSGAIGELQKVEVWGNRQLHRDGYLPALGEPPENLDYDLWIGPSPFHPYNPGYFSAEVDGANCLSWNMYWDFGSGQVGDMGSHSMDLAWNAIDADAPTEITAEGDPFNPEVTPVKLTSHFAIPANDWRPAIKLSWFQGGAMPEEPVPNAFEGIGHGALFAGSKGWVLSDYSGGHVMIPKGADEINLARQSSGDGNYDHAAEWIAACKGGPETSCNFDYGGKMIETMLLGLVAYRTGGTLAYDSSAGKVTNNEEANQLLHRVYRDGWPLEG